MHLKIRSLAVFMLVVGAVAGCAAGPSTVPASGTAMPSPSGAAPAAQRPDTQRDEGGAVTVEAAWAGPEAGATFDVTLDTHSVDLDALDLSDATLRNDRGDTLAAEPWAAAKGGHHREGTLVFKGDATTFFAGARSVDLIILGVGGVPERTLRWELTP